MLDHTETLSSINLDDPDPVEFTSHVVELSVNENTLGVLSNKGQLTHITPFSEGGNDSLLTLEIVDDRLVQTFSISGESEFALERRVDEVKTLSYVGEGFVTAVTDSELIFTNPFADGFTLTETDTTIEVDLSEVSVAPRDGLMYDNYAAFANVSTEINTTGINAGSTANTRVPLNTTFVNNIPTFAHRPNASPTVYIQPGTYWVKLTTPGYSADGGRCSININTSANVGGGTGLTAQSAIGKVSQDCCRLVTVVAASELYINQTRTRGAIFYGGGDVGSYNVHVLLEVWKIG